MSNKFAYISTDIQIYNERIKQINKIREYQIKKKNRRMILCIYGAIAITIPIATLGLVTLINLPCGIAATILLGIPLVKAKHHCKILKQELQEMEQKYPFIKPNENEDCDELETRTKKVFLDVMTHKSKPTDARKRYSTKTSAATLEENKIPEQKVQTQKTKKLTIPFGRRG